MDHLGFPRGTNRSMTAHIPADQMARIIQMHKDSKHNAFIYVLVVLGLYFVALGFLVGRYLQQERDHVTLFCIARFGRRCFARCRRTSKSETPAPSQVSINITTSPSPRVAAIPGPQPVDKAPVSESSSDSGSSRLSAKADLNQAEAPRMTNLTVCTRNGGESPSIVSVMVCEVKDTQV